MAKRIYNFLKQRIKDDPYKIVPWVMWISIWLIINSFLYIVAPDFLIYQLFGTTKVGLSGTLQNLIFTVYTTLMESKHFLKAAALSLILVLIFIGGLEYYWRSQGFPLSYNDDKMLWAHVRRQVYLPADKATVFVGSSRIKWDIDVETWEKQTGEKALQLGLVGTSPRKIVFDLADDEKFAGKLVIDVTGLFRLDPYADMFSTEALEYYHNETPAQRASALLDFAVESKLVLLEEGKFGLNSLIRDNSEHNRVGVRNPAIPILKEYSYSTFSRQAVFSPAFVNSPALQEDQKKRWESRFGGNAGRVQFMKGTSLDSLFLAYKGAAEKIRSRGGSVVFVHLPVSGFYLKAELETTPRKQYWDRLLELTGVPGIDYADYEQTAGLLPLEHSHLSPNDAVKYTTSLIHILSKEIGWKFPLQQP